jgi:hypothetical protein
MSQSVEPDLPEETATNINEEGVTEILARPETDSSMSLQVASIPPKSSEGKVEAAAGYFEVEEKIEDSRPFAGVFNVKRRHQSQDSDHQRPLKRQNAGNHVQIEPERTNVVPVSVLYPEIDSHIFLPTNNHRSNEQLDSEHGSLVPEACQLSFMVYGNDSCSIGDSGDIPSLPSLQGTACREKRTNHSAILSRPNMAHLFVSGGETLRPSRVDNEEHLETRDISTTSECDAILSPQEDLEKHQATAEIPCRKPEIDRSSVTERPMTVHRDIMPDPVIKPARLHSLLAKIGINWHLDVVTEWLSKASVVQCHGFPVRRYTKAEIRKIQMFAEFLFVNSNLEDAFPLFHQA